LFRIKQPHEQALRSLVRFFNTKHYGAYAPLLHRRQSLSGGGEHQETVPPSPGGGPGYSEEDVFPPNRSFDHDSVSRSTLYGQPQSPLSPSASMSLQSQQDTSLDEALEYGFDDLLYPQYSIDQDGELETSPSATKAAWDRLGNILGHYDDEITDSESVGSFGLLDFRGSNGMGRGGEVSGSDDGISDFEMDDEEEVKQRNREWENIG
jgi:hypothetical protein